MKRGVATLPVILVILLSVAAGAGAWLLVRGHGPQQPEISAYSHGHLTRVGPYLYCNVVDLDDCQTPQAQGDTRLFRDHDVLTSGVVGVRLPGMRGVPVVSQGCRPIGYPYIVTGADGILITELGGRPPLQRLREIVEGLSPDERALVSHGLQIGIVVDEHLAAPGQGDFVIRGLLGADPSTGSIEIDEVVQVGATMQFQVRDAAGADKDLRLTVERAAARLPGRAAGALLFTCNGRGRRMFGVADHDASTIEELLGGIPLAGFFAAGEIGPIAGRNALHGFTASMALFVDDME
ncbi:FIST C domain protein [Mycobacterium tuberculosis]|nr:FIST C domain protein [Mycobacterium tuberculosis]